MRFYKLKNFLRRKKTENGRAERWGETKADASLEILNSAVSVCSSFGLPSLFFGLS
jgi:hypothetical protein